MKRKKVIQQKAFSGAWLKLLFSVLVFAPLFLFAQIRTISGTVKDETGKPLEGVSIQIKGKSTGTQTDALGNFSISASKGDVLQISSVNHSGSNVTVGSASSYPIILKQKEGSLNEVVVVGYGTQKRKDVTGAISVIDKKMLENRPVTNSVDALQGTAPGLVVTRNSGQPGQESWNLNIRGFASLNGINQPLVIVDGVEYPDLTKINPDDIDNISVLKDAAAAAIYGAKAANGVILVTTKKGASGKLTLSYTALMTIKKPMEVPQRNHSWQDATMQNLANINNGGSAPFSAQQLSWMQSPDSNFVPTDPTKGFYYYDLNPGPMVLRTSSPSQQHNLDISGGDSRSQYFIGLGYYNGTGIFKFGPDGNQRYNARLNYITKFGKYFSLDSRVAFTQNKIQAPSANVQGDYGLLYNLYAIREMYPVFVPGDNTKYASGNTSATYAILKDGGYSNTLQNLLDGVFTLKAENFVKGLSLRMVFSPHLEQDNYDNLSRTIPTWSFDLPSNSFVQKTFFNATNSVTKTRTTQTSTSTNLLADYDLKVSDDHHFHLLGGFQYQYYNYNYLYAKNSSLVNNDLPTLNYTTNATLPPGYVGDDWQTNVWVSYFGRFNYDYKQKYYFEATLRSDASSKLAPGHQTQMFPSVSANWRISQEDWFQNAVPFVDELKIRGSWGQLGNAQLGQYPWQQNYNSVTMLSNGAYPFNNSATPYVYQGGLPSPGLGWETISTSDGGLDLALLRNRLNFSFDYFQRINNNMLITLNQPALLGVSPSTTNAAAMKTWGWETSVGWKDRVGKFNYYVNLNVGDNQNKITKYLGNVVYSEGLNKAILGMPINSIFGYQVLGYFQSQDEVTKSAVQFNTTKQGPGDLKYQDVNGDQKINGGVGTAADHGDLVYLGNTSPRYTFGISGGASWKGIDVSFFFQGVGKRNIILYPNEAIPWVESWRNPMANYYNNYWTPTNTHAQFPRPIAGGGTNAHINSQFVQNAAYIRLKNLQVGYTIPASIISKAKIQSLRIFFTGQDIWTKTKMWYQYFDPESPNNVAFNYPFFSSYAFGVNLTF
jgi:TonB-linked SusC/RagA family outer membrane protein